MIPFTKPFLPDKDKFNTYIDGIWERKWLTNQGPLVSLLEKKMGEYLGTPHISFVSSGTMGLQLALKSLKQKGEIITTPYSYVATTSAIVWEGHTPIYADILPDKLTLNPRNVEAIIGPNTVAILATHLYGNACDTVALEKISVKYNIPIIYDGAHCFGSAHLGKSLLSYGDYSILSTHATKLFHTANGGFVISKSAEAKEQIDRLKNFGHDGQNNFNGIGINGKNSELHAALGLCLLDHSKELVSKRRKQWDIYFEQLTGSRFKCLNVENKEGFNGAYFPITCPPDIDCDALISMAKSKEIEIRKYFYPSLDTLDYVNGGVMPVSRNMADRICCLPLYHEMTSDEQMKVIELLKSILK